MPLPTAADRELQHMRDISVRGYLRTDGLIDLEAHMRDTKPYTWGNHDRGRIAAGEPLHDMWLRLTVDQTLLIVGVEAAMDATPFGICPGVIPNFQRLVGISIGKGYAKAAMTALGGVQGCTHLRELLQQLGTVAYQTMFSIRRHEKAPSGKPAAIPHILLNTCYTYDEHGELAQRLAARAAAAAE